MKRPVIGIGPGWDEPNTRYTLGHKYPGWMAHCGAVPLILPYTEGPALEQTVALLDGVIISGGPDVSPELYGETRLECCGNSQLNRDRFEIALFHEAQKQGKPVLGICKGCQIINTALGGTLYQDIQTLAPGNPMAHRRPKDGNTAPEGEVQELFRHMCNLTPGGPLAELLDTNVCEITSYHHQSAKVLAPGLTVMATAPDGIVEAFYRADGTFLWGLQFHPEMFDLGHELSAKIFGEFLRHCK